MELCWKFGTHIAPRKNESVQLKKERFNRFAYACACAVCHVEDLWTFLDKYKHVTNNLACVLRAFQDVDCLVTFFLASNPWCSPYWTIPYSQLQQWCDILRAHPCGAKAVWKPHNNSRYKEFTGPVQANLQLCPWKPIQVTAVAQETSGCSGSLAVEQNKPELVKIFKLMPPKLAAGWLRQLGNVFGFGDFDQESPRLLRNIDPDIFDKAPINNMAAKRQVGQINYELIIRGSKGLKAASSSNVKAQS